MCEDKEVDEAKVQILGLEEERMETGHMANSYSSLGHYWKPFMWAILAHFPHYLFLSFHNIMFLSLSHGFTREPHQLQPLCPASITIAILSIERSTRASHQPRFWWVVGKPRESIVCPSPTFLSSPSHYYPLLGHDMCMTKFLSSRQANPTQESTKSPTIAQRTEGHRYQWMSSVFQAFLAFWSSFELRTWNEHNKDRKNVKIA